MTIHKRVQDGPKCGTVGRWVYLESDQHKANCKRCLGQVKRRKHTNTVNRGWLKRRILEGKVIAKCDSYFTDDYAFDAAYNYQKTDWLPARIEDNYGQRDGAYLYFNESDFRGHGYAWKRENGDIALSFGFSSYTLRVQQ